MLVANPVLRVSAERERQEEATGERPRVVLREEPRRGPGADVEVGGDLARQRLEVFRWKAQCQKALNRKNNQGGLERGGHLLDSRQLLGPHFDFDLTHLQMRCYLANVESLQSQMKGFAIGSDHIC